MNDYYDFGELVREARKKRKITQKRLAGLLNVNESVISKYETNQAFPSFDTMRALAKELGVSIDYLCGNESRGMVSLYGLSGEQEDILKELAELFRKQSGNTKRLSEEQYAILGKITVVFLKKHSTQ